MLKRDGMKQLANVCRILTTLTLGGMLCAPFPAQAAGDPAKGKAIYEKQCLHCHGPQGKGDGPTGRLLKPQATDFTGAASRKKTDADFLQTIENGKPGTGMAPWKGPLTGADIADVLAYLTLLRK